MRSLSALVLTLSLGNNGLMKYFSDPLKFD